MNKSPLLLFIDIDGVLNDHAKTPSGYCGIKPECAAQLNRITDATGAALVISSAWRYLMVGEMTVKGFESMLRTHGIKGRVRGHTRLDTMIVVGGESVPVPDERGEQIREWIAINHDERLGLLRYVVIDDLDLGISAAGHPFVQTDGKVGLTEGDGDRAIEILTTGDL